MTLFNRRYLAYLLRLWQDIDAEKIIWRASLEEPHSGNKQGFANIQELIDYIHQQVGGFPPDNRSSQDQANESR